MGLGGERLTTKVVAPKIRSILAAHDQLLCGYPVNRADVRSWPASDYRATVFPRADGGDSQS
jgi:hypothetical protein